MIHDPALRYEPAFSDAAASAALTLESHRLAADTDLLLRELHDSRARIAASADHERSRIERKIHEVPSSGSSACGYGSISPGGRARTPRPRRSRFANWPARSTPRSPRSRHSHAGTYPYVLTPQGLAAALAAMTNDAPVATTVLVESRRRYAADLENAVYFCCVEAVQHASTHAGGATAVHITVVECDNSLCLDVCDDGGGFDLDAVPAGAGLTNVRDRVAAVGGRVTIESTPGRGTRISATIPLAPARVADE